jgi:hypothetical protein
VISARVSQEGTTMYNPIFEMISDSVVDERIADAERQRTANTLARESSSARSSRAGWLHRMLLALTHRSTDATALWRPTSEAVAPGQVGRG